MIIYADCLVAEPEPEQLVLPNAGQVFLHFFTLMNSSSRSSYPVASLTNVSSLLFRNQ